MPTNKWWTATVVALGAFVTAVIQAGRFDQSLQIALVGIVVQRLVAYLTPNTPDSVPPLVP